jgi:hypothetical protein
VFRREEMRVMPDFQVRFLKDVYNSIGHGRRICQRIIEVAADSPADAVRKAQECVPTWSFKADSIEIEMLTEPPRPLTAAKWPARSLQ